MEFISVHITSICIVSAAFCAILFALIIFGKQQLLSKSTRKADDNKVLLKELLEGYDLEIPSELLNLKDI